MEAEYEGLEGETKESLTESYENNEPYFNLTIEETVVMKIKQTQNII